MIGRDVEKAMASMCFEEASTGLEVARHV